MFNPAGGMHHHLGALVHRRLWRPHFDHTRLWLEGWRPKKKDLVLLGPSAGYSLPLEFLSRFERIVALDPDRLSLFLLARRFSTLRIETASQDYLRGPDQELWPEGVMFLLDDYPEAAFLFCNVLGQLPLLAKRFVERREVWQKNFFLFQENAEWASYHDLWSAPGRAKLAPWTPQADKNDDRIRRSAEIFLTKPAKWLRDHETQFMFLPDCERALWTWQRTPRQVHCIEGVRASKQLAGA